MLKFPNIPTQGTPTAAARCIGPLSCPIKSFARFITAALSRGPRRPHKFKMGPGQYRGKFRGRGQTHRPSRQIPEPSAECLTAINRNKNAQLSFPQSLLSTFPPILTARKSLPLSGDQVSISNCYFICSQAQVPECAVIQIECSKRCQTARQARRFTFGKSSYGIEPWNTQVATERAPTTCRNPTASEEAEIAERSQ